MRIGKMNTLCIQPLSGLGFSAAVSGSRVDREAGVIRGVAVITEGVAKGHGVKVDAVTLRQVFNCAKTYGDGLKVQQDHGSGVMAAVGVIKGLRIEGSVLRGDLYPLRTYEQREKLFDMAETMPGNFGLSISFTGSPESIGRDRFARCVEIYSADLVGEPAANPSGLFSTPNPSTPMTPEEIIKAIESLREEMNSRFAKLETATPPVEPTTTVEIEKELAAIKAQLAEFSGKIDSKTELAKVIAQEFAAVRGTATVAPAPVVDAKPDAATAFAAAVVEAKSKLPASRKADAFAQVAKTDAAGYAAFTAALKTGKTFTL